MATAKKKPAASKPAAKKGSAPKSPNDGKGTKAQLEAFKKNPKPFVATSVVGSKGSKPNMNQGKPVAAGGGRNIPKIRKTPQMSSSAFRGSGTPLGSSFAKPTRSQLLNAGLTATGAAAATGFKVVSKTIVSEGTKKLQRELATLKRDQSMKKMTPAQRRAAGESFDEMDPVAKWEIRGEREMLQSDISKSMKSTNKTKKNIKRK
jgi:hypothetical protein